MGSGGGGHTPRGHLLLGRAALLVGLLDARAHLSDRVAQFARAQLQLLPHARHGRVCQRRARRAHLSLGRRAPHALQLHAPQMLNVLVLYCTVGPSLAAPVRMNKKKGQVQRLATCWRNESSSVCARDRSSLPSADSSLFCRSLCVRMARTSSATWRDARCRSSRERFSASTSACHSRALRPEDTGTRIETQLSRLGS